MFLNTVKTMAGYCNSLVRKYSPLGKKTGQLEDIYNYLPVNDKVSTSGQPTEEEFKLIKQAGFAYVINLAPHNAENSLKNEAGVLADLGLHYCHIPVNFFKPSLENFKEFKRTLGEIGEAKVWVHCAANMRVSAFMYKYRTQCLNEKEAIAKERLHKIWVPIGVWKPFIDSAI
jgi:protein tyrosine phosphatase (PTP) superfamily phosphohydrolase (DUF442 family)